MNFYQLLMLPPSIIVMLVAVSRLNSIKRNQISARWCVRRIGLLLLFSGMVMVVASPFTETAPIWFSITRLMIVWGLALTFATSPGLPPLWAYYERARVPQPDTRTFRAKFRDELIELWRSFSGKAN